MRGVANVAETMIFDITGNDMPVIELPGINASDINIDYSQINTFDSVMDIIYQSLDGKKIVLQDADTLMKNISYLVLDSTVAAGYFEVFSKILPQLIVIYPCIKPVRPQLSAEMEAFVIEESEMLAAVGARINAREDEQNSKYGKKYSWFKPTLEFGALLDEVYNGENDPGVIIASYLNLLYPEDITKDCNQVDDDFDFDPDKKIEFGSPLHRLITTVGYCIIDTLDFEPKLKQAISTAFRQIIDPNDKDYDNCDISVEEISIAVLNAPPDFYYTWLHVWYFDDSFDPRVTLAQFETFLLFYRIGEGNEPAFVNNTELIRHTLPVAMYPENGCRKHISYKTLSKFFFSARSSGLIGRCDDVTLKLIKVVVDDYTKYRRTRFGGVSTVGVWHLESISTFIFGLDGISPSVLDIILMLPNGNYFISEYLLDLDPDSYPAPNENCNHAFIYYQAAYHKAVEEGLYELGAALLSFYLVARTFICKGNLGNLAEIVQLIDKAIVLPGSACLKTTLGHINYLIMKYYPNEQLPQLANKVISQYLPLKAKLHVLKGGKASEELRYSEPDVTALLIRELGVDRWEKLSQTSQQLIISAEMLWKNSAVEFGFGIKDWSGIITPYCKAIEYELVERLKEFYYSEEYFNYLKGKGQNRGANPTAGGLLYEIKAFKILPEGLQQYLIRSNLKLWEDQKLTIKLIDIMTNYRNKAAHKDIVGMKVYTEFKEKLFNDRILHTFIDSCS